MLLLVVSTHVWGQAAARCVDILREYGFLPAGPDIGLIALTDLPKCLNAEELKGFIREHGGEICCHEGAAIRGLRALVRREPARGYGQYSSENASRTLRTK
jgi:hypothetical protein